jgi:hypothetical protein
MSIDRDYFLRRAEEELERGEAATMKCAADAHFELAGRYFDLAHRGEPNLPTARGRERRQPSRGQNPASSFHPDRRRAD